MVVCNQDDRQWWRSSRYALARCKTRLMSLVGADSLRAKVDEENRRKTRRSSLDSQKGSSCVKQKNLNRSYALLPNEQDIGILSILESLPGGQERGIDFCPLFHCVRLLLTSGVEYRNLITNQLSLDPCLESVQTPASPPSSPLSVFSAS
jgi:hypothetical protein